VLDSREDPANETYLDEINFLKSCGVPLIVSMNFIHRKESRIADWEQSIRRLGVSNIIQFDAHTRTWEDEQDLFKCMRPLLRDHQHGKLHREFMDFWSKLREEATAAIEALFGFMTLGIPTLVAAAFGYFGASAWQMESEGGGTELTFKPTNAMLMLIASATLSLAKELKSRGRAAPHLINVQLNQDVINKKSALAHEILELNKWKHRDTDYLKKCLHEEINK